MDFSQQDGGKERAKRQKHNEGKHTDFFCLHQLISQTSQHVRSVRLVVVVVMLGGAAGADSTARAGVIFTETKVFSHVVFGCCLDTSVQL